ncbi:substrate-binding domain-containing protein, partial [uncultured Brevundimonas sp.]|uniref:substrate-binding domain-containing protein n=1 Tax=uncultured Brevundimonas sp. TaxID=213418 RepID=UPI0034561E64
IIWNIWQVANPEVADLVEVEEPYRIWRDTGAVVTRLGREDMDSGKFLEFLRSPTGAEIFRRWGWMTDAPRDAPDDD